MLTVSEDAEDLVELLRAGAAGYLLKNIETDYLINAILAAARGESSHLAADDRQTGTGTACPAQDRDAQPS